MGSINCVWDPKYWKLTLEGYSKLTNDDIIYQMIVGCGDDYPSYYDLYIYISKVNYENILNGKYKIKKRPYDYEPIEIYDENNCQIPLIINEGKVKKKQLKL